MTARIVPGSIAADTIDALPLVTPDVPLPTHYAPPRRAEHELLQAVLQAVIDDATSEDPVRRADAEEWLADDAVTPFAFRWISEHLGLDAGATRRAISRRQRRLPPILYDVNAGAREDRLYVRHQRNRCAMCRELHICRYTRRSEFKGGVPVMVCRDCWPKLPGVPSTGRPGRDVVERRVESVVDAVRRLGGIATYSQIVDHATEARGGAQLGVTCAVRRGRIVRIRHAVYALPAAEVTA